MENLTDDLLILADLENGTSNVREPEELTIVSLIDEAVSSVETQAKRKQIEIDINCSDKLKANLYGSFILQALINLIDNAIKYSQAKSKVWVKAYSEGEELFLEVRDKGIGIPAEQQERIFERFYRVDRSRSREAGGTGLGLSIVRHIALLHRGIAEVESRAGEGSIFRIKVPLNLNPHHQ
jgi:two-component system phosphate regulon sensor histidine kinase PhoR